LWIFDGLQRAVWTNAAAARFGTFDWVEANIMTAGSRRPAATALPVLSSAQGSLRRGDGLNGAPESGSATWAATDVDAGDALHEGFGIFGSF